MKLSGFDGKRVRLTAAWGETYEGVCAYNGREYNEFEFGRDEEGVALPGFIFFKKDIRKIKELDAFTGRYGFLEEEALREGADIVCEVLLSEEDAHVRRMLACIGDHAAISGAEGLPDSDAIVEALRGMPAPHDPELVRMIDRTVRMLGGGHAANDL